MNKKSVFILGLYGVTFWSQSFTALASEQNDEDPTRFSLTLVYNTIGAVDLAGSPAPDYEQECYQLYQQKIGLEANFIGSIDTQKAMGTVEESYLGSTFDMSNMGIWGQNDFLIGFPTKITKASSKLDMRRYRFYKKTKVTRIILDMDSTLSKASSYIMFEDTLHQDQAQCELSAEGSMISES